MITAKILADSVSPAGHRLSTLELTYPRIIHAEMLTHRSLSRNGASSRAIPVERLIADVRENPYIPAIWTSNQKGMQGGEPLTGNEAAKAYLAWTNAMDEALKQAWFLARLGVHKQHVNRLLEPFQWYTAIFSGTEDAWEHFLNLRDNTAAQPEIQVLAMAIDLELTCGTPTPKDYGEYHLPLVDEDDWVLLTDTRIKLAVARCARVSYNRHLNKKSLDEDVALYDRLLANGHLSPFEHVATPYEEQYWENHYPMPKPPGNFTGWLQHRHEVAA